MNSPPKMTKAERAAYVAFLGRFALVADKANRHNLADHLRQGAIIVATPPESFYGQPP